MAAAELGSNLTVVLVYAAILVAFYFMWFRPQQAARKKAREMLAALAIGDRVMTAGGILGVIRGFEGELLDIEIAPGVVARFTRRAVIERVVDAVMPTDD